MSRLGLKICSQAFLSGGKRFASPLTVRGGTRATASAGREDRKGPSFADLLNAKGRSSYRSLSANRSREKNSTFASPSPITVGVALVGPDSDFRPPKSLMRDSPTAQKEAPPPACSDESGSRLLERLIRDSPAVDKEAPPPGPADAAISSTPSLPAHEESSKQAIQVGICLRSWRGRSLSWLQTRKVFKHLV
jgi:hypothetical protein